MKQRSKRPEQTRRAILEAAGAGFCRNGYAGTGLGEITGRAGLTKGALFHHFADKRSLALAWIREWMGKEIEDQWIRPLEALDSLGSLVAWGRARCMEMRADNALSALVLLSAETYGSEPELWQALEERIASLRSAVASLLERGKTQGWIHRSIQPENEAAWLVSAFMGITITAKRADGETLHRACSSSLEAYLETLRAE